MALTRQQQQLAALLKTQLSSFGFNVSKYIDQAIRSGTNDIGDYAYMLIVHSPEFKAAFPGITDAQGRLRVSPAEYLQRAESFTSTAAQYGFQLNKAQIGGLVKNNVDPQEFQIRAAGVQAVRENPDMISFLQQQINDFNASRAKNHLSLIPQVKNLADAVNFMTGRSDTEVYAAYEGALFQSQAKQAGLKPLSSAQARGLAQFTPGVLGIDETQKRFTDLAMKLHQAGSDLSAFGISQNDLLTLEFGGPNQTAIGLKAEQALAQSQAKPAVDEGANLQLNKQQLPVLSDAATSAQQTA